MHYQDERNHSCRISDAWTYRGLKTVVLENEMLRVTVIADKGADIFELVHKPSDTDFMWRTPWSVRNQALWVPSTGWGEGIFHDLYIGGWNTIAPTGGFAQDYMGAEIGQHNETNMMPWDVHILEDSPMRVSAKFSVRAVRTPFWIEKTITLEKDSPVVTVQDTLINEAEEPAPVQWGQHVALGEPFLRSNCILDMPGAGFIVPAQEGDELPAGTRLTPGQIGKWHTAEAPDGSEVDLRRFPPKSDRLVDYLSFNDLSDGWYAVTNPDRGLGIGIVWNKELFRYLWYWQVFGGHSGYPWYKRTYNVGLEPFTSLPSGMPEPGTNQSTSVIFQPGEKRTTTVHAVIYQSTNGITNISPDVEVSMRE